MATTWTNIFVATPTSDGSYWIVRLPYFDTPKLADYTSPDSNFTWTDSNGQTVAIGFNEVFKWRDL
jgi:hypothetical protein